MHLIVYSTNRAIREQKAKISKKNTFLPKMLSIAEFEKIVIIPKKPFVDNLQRKLFLQEASNFEEFKKLKIGKEFIKFFTHSDDIFRFYEELSFEKVKINELFLQDIYAEFEEELSALELLLKNYKNILNKHQLSDKVFLYDDSEWELNRSYLANFKKITIVVDGFLTKFELELFKKIAKVTELELEFFATPFNKKMQKIFQKLGFNINQNGYYYLNLTSNKVQFKKCNIQINKTTQALATNSRFLQIALAFAKIEEFVKEGIAPEKIALILPDETIAPIIRKYDKLNNLNLAMGFSFIKHQGYIEVKNLYEALKGLQEAKEYLKALNIQIPLDNEKIKIDAFFQTLKELGFSFYQDLEKNLEEIGALNDYIIFKNVFKDRKFMLKDWLFLWLEHCKNFKIDDIKGGKVTAIGLLESRGVEFDGVVIIDFNENYVPAISKKDRFLNSAIRKKALLPTKIDRENLQKHYYATILHKAKKSALIFVQNDELAPSKFLYELGIKEYKRYEEPIHLFYNRGKVNINSHLKRVKVPFNAKDIIWSNSKLKTFLNCKRAFFYRYMQKLQPIKEEFIEGRALHQIIAQVLKPQSNFLHFDELQKRFNQQIDAYECNDKEIEYKKHIWKEMLIKFLKREFEHLQNGWQIIASEKKVSGKIEGLEFVGIIDRIDVKESEYFIIDYKSGTIDNKKDASKSNDFQLIIYDLLYQAKKKNLAYIDLFEGKKEELKSFEDKKERFFEFLQNIKALKEIELERCEDLSHCRFCEYRLLCHRGEYL